MVIKAFYVHNVIPGDDGPTSRNPMEPLQGKICEISDKSLGPAFKIRVPSDFTVYHTESNASLSLETSDETNNGEMGHIQHRIKLKFLFIGNEIPPDLSFMDISLIDRVEFHGSICSDLPVFDIISRLPSIRKVKFFFGKRQIAIFQPWTVNTIEDRFVNKSVTSLTVITEKDIPRKVINEDKRLQLEMTLEEIVVHILSKASNCFPYLRKISLDIPFSVRLERAATQLQDELIHLKPTVIEIDSTGERLLAKKQDTENMCDGITRSYTEADETLNTSSSLAPTIDLNTGTEVEGNSESEKVVGAEESNRTYSECDDNNSSQVQTPNPHIENNQPVLSKNSEPIQSLHSDKILNSGAIPLTSIRFNVEPSSIQTDASSSLTDLGKLLESMLGVSSLEFKSISESTVAYEK